MNVCVVLVTYNRLEYTKKTIARLLEDPSEEFELYLWDNASTDETPEYLKEEVKDPRIVETILSKENVGQTGAMNYAWSKTRAELVGKLDNDCLVTPGWTRIFAQAHKDIEMLGTVACWNFPIKCFDEKRAAKKIFEYNGHKIFVHPNTCGSGFIIKKKTFDSFGPWDKGIATGTTEYFYKMALAGYINGWYYPLILQEHMDYVDSEHSRFHRYSFDEAYRDGYGYKFANIRDMETYIRRHKEYFDILMDGPIDPHYYIGWRAKFRRILKKAKGILLE